MKVSQLLLYQVKQSSPIAENGDIDVFGDIAEYIIPNTMIFHLPFYFGG